MYIKQENLTIRNATASDTPQLGKWWRDGKVMAHAGFPLGLSMTDDEIVRDLATDTDATFRRLIIEADLQPVGEMSYRNKGNQTAEIGIKICDFSMQGKGYGTRLLRMLIGALFGCYGYEKIILDTNLNNKRAQHIYEKIGFRNVGERINSWKNQIGELQSAMDYELLKTEYVYKHDDGNKAGILCHIRLDTEADRDYIFERHCRINYECDTPWARKLSYEEYHANYFAWYSQQNGFLSSLRDSMADERTIAEIIKTESGENVAYLWVPFHGEDEHFIWADVSDIYNRPLAKSKKI